MPAKDGKWRILALDGGGVRGLLTLEVLRALEEQSGRRLHKMFDAVVGTSTGGLIALALTRAGGLTSDTLQDTYLRFCPEIFRRSTGQKIRSMAQLAGPKYSNAALYRCVLQMVSGRDHMGDARLPCMVTTYDLNKRTPRFYTSWDTPEVLMLDAAMSTTAAPTYFAPWHDNVDGGVCDNNPALSGVIEWCRKVGCTVRDCLVVSVGTGSDSQPYDGAQAASWGLLTWAEPLVSLFTDGTSELHAYHLQRLLPDSNVLRLQTKVTGAAAEMDNADPANLRALQQIGRQLADEREQAIDAMLERLA